MWIWWIRILIRIRILNSGSGYRLLMLLSCRNGTMFAKEKIKILAVSKRLFGNQFLFSCPNRIAVSKLRSSGPSTFAICDMLFPVS
jgi:hypothetical protein